MNRIRALNQSDSEHQLDTSISVLPEKALEVRFNQNEEKTQPTQDIFMGFHCAIAFVPVFLFRFVGHQTPIHRSIGGKTKRTTQCGHRHISTGFAT